MKWQRFIRVGILLSALSAGLLLPTADALAATKALNVNTPTQEEIIQYINSHEKSGRLTYSQNPDSANPPYSAGSLSAQSQQEGLDALNEVRYIAGIASDVTTNDTYTSQAQAGALINCVNKQLNHRPSKPDGMDDALYNLGYQGTSKGNIAWATYERTLDQTLIHGWMADESSSNLATVGHRRWCLNPSMQQTGFGAATGSNGTYSVMYAFDRSRSLSTQPIVAWPAQNMPTDYFATNYPWSISSSTAFSNDVSVKLTRISDNQVWNFSNSSAENYFTYNRDSYGQSHCLIFRPSGITAYYSGDQYRVQVTENQTVTLDYTVNFFDLDEVPADTTITLSPTSGKVDISSNGTYRRVAGITLSNPDVSMDKIILSSSDETVARALINSSGLFICGLKDGIAAITLSLSRDISATFYVTVGTGTDHTHTYSSDYRIDVNPTCTQPGSKYRYCTGCGQQTDVTAIPAAGHSYGEWQTVTAATSTADGLKERICSVCKEKETEVIPATGHNGDEGAVTQTPNTPSAPSAPAIGTVFSDASTGARYQITTAGTVEYQGPVSRTASGITVPQAVTLDGMTFRVTAIGANAFSRCSRLKSVMIGKNVISIGDKAFYKCTALTKITIPAKVSRIGKQAFSGCKKLKNITIKTKKLTSKTVGSKAFKGIHTKATVKVPKAKLKAYKKLLRAKGVGKKVKIKK